MVLLHPTENLLIYFSVVQRCENRTIGWMLHLFPCRFSFTSLATLDQILLWRRMTLCKNFLVRLLLDGVNSWIRDTDENSPPPKMNLLYSRLCWHFFQRWWMLADRIYRTQSAYQWKLPGKLSRFVVTMFHLTLPNKLKKIYNERNGRYLNIHPIDFVSLRKALNGFF